MALQDFPVWSRTFFHKDKVNSRQNRLFLTTGTVNKDMKIIADNYGHNILRIFDVLPNFPFTTSETKRDY